MDKLLYLSGIAVLSYLFSCQPNLTPRPLNYGTDQCANCRMTIVDPAHAAQIVTTKGKVLKYDAIECMLRDVADKPELPVAVPYICDYQRSGEWLDATTASYLVSPNIPSPMGAYLSAVGSEEAAIALQRAEGGTVYTWATVFTIFK